MTTPIQNLRSNVDSKRPTASGLAFGQIAINYNENDPAIYLRGDSDALLKIAPVYIASGAPNATPASGGTSGNSIGEQWLDISTSPATLKLWDGSNWLSPGATSIASGVIVDADVNASAAIAGTKIDPDFGSQTIETTGVINAGSGTEAAPAITVGTTDNGLYSPGTDEVAISTSGTGRLFVDANGNVGIGASTPNNYANYSTLTLDGTTGGIIDLEAGGTICGELQALANEFRINAVGASGVLKFYAGASERARIDSSGRLLVGTSSALQIGSTNSAIQVRGTGPDNAGLSISRFSDNGASGYLSIGKARGSIATPVIVDDDDIIGTIQFAAYDGGDLATSAAEITAEVDGTPGADDMPGRLVFSTTADGTNDPTERMRITSDAYVRLASGTGGIQFNGDTAAANALDDYEEGTWTPVITGQTTAGTGTYSTQVGRYTKVGRQVYCSGTLIWTAHDGTGSMRIEGLPFASSNISDLFNAAVFAYVANITMPANSILMGDMQNASSRIILRSVVTGGGTPATLAIDSTGNIYFSITYQTN